MAYELLELEISDGVALLRLNRPKVLNSLNEQLIREIRSALAEVSEDLAVRAFSSSPAPGAASAPGPTSGGGR